MLGKLVVLRGGGDIATGIAHRLRNCGFNVVILEMNEPTVIRRRVAFAQAVFEGEVIVEDVKAKRIENTTEVHTVLGAKCIPVMVDPEGKTIGDLKPDVVVDATLAKVNKGTIKEMAPLVIGVGPGFTAGLDVHVVVESQRGHDLGKVIWNGRAHRNTGIPGEIMGISEERIVRATGDGKIRNLKPIGTRVEKGEIIAHIGELPVEGRIDGVLRGMIENGSTVKDGMKIGDIDPRGIRSYCFTISDKARSIAGGVLEAILMKK
ncbi:biotin/lipoyl attachment [Alkaliphilus metalliredigens QYMF]|uniref:Biotin/lipoyl attachment n=1 Tax=Alkaliphilus metalliredigens (strain QYMF) TaxID=293826 RepID=A6TWR6_ALKMQ|nr:selenium-dependent molybdenum cofactor biosynthesis protein YqeB [Alkaliphilus metalliredigens]ABR50634.1 biotin/lipoyl attachment [Alkaliphilus metalliredigens QYMF]